MTAATPAAKPASATLPAATPADPAEPAPLAAAPAPESPAAETPPVKQAAAKKRHRKTVRPAEQANPFANPWRGRETSYSRYGQGSWYSYR
jgi:hypothetical protein